VLNEQQEVIIKKSYDTAILGALARVQKAQMQIDCLQEKMVEDIAQIACAIDPNTNILPY